VVDTDRQELGYKSVQSGTPNPDEYPASSVDEQVISKIYDHVL
jgi:hypothetical protein